MMRTEAPLRSQRSADSRACVARVSTLSDTWAAPLDAPLRLLYDQSADMRTRKAAPAPHPFRVVTSPASACSSAQAGRAMTSPMKNSRSALDLDKTLIKAKPVTSQNRVLGAQRARRADAWQACAELAAAAAWRGAGTPFCRTDEAGSPMRSDRRRRLPRQPPGGLPHRPRRPRACCGASGGCAPADSAVSHLPASAYGSAPAPTAAPQVIVMDNFFTGSHANVAHHLGKPNFELLRHDIVEPILLEVRARSGGPPAASCRLQRWLRRVARCLARGGAWRASAARACMRGWSARAHWLTPAHPAACRWTRFTTWRALRRPCTTSTTR